MSGFDYIRIRGLDTVSEGINPGLYEIFQGIGESSVEAGELAETPISNDPELAEGLWQGQNEKLESENDYCDHLQKIFKSKQERIDGVWDKILDVMEELIGEWLGKLVAGWVFFETGSLDLGWLAGFLTEIGTEWGFDALRLLLTRGNELLDGIKAENNQLLTIEKSRENYEYREQVLTRHREDIRIVLDQIRQAEKQVEINTQLEMKALLERIADLAMRDDTIELGDMRLHSQGRVVNF